VAATAAALALAACGGGGTPPLPTTTFGTAETPAATPTTTQEPEHMPTTTPAAANQSPEDVVKAAFLKKWLSTLSGRPQEGRNPDKPDVYSYVLIEPENMDEWQHNIPILLAGGTSDTPLLVRFQLGGTGDGKIEKISGELQLTNMTLHASCGVISDFQKNTGTECGGWAQVNSDLAYRSIYRGGYYDNSSSKTAQVAWLKEPESSPLPSAFSDVQREATESSYTIRNGVLKDDQQDTWATYGQALLPFSAMLPEHETCQVGYNVAPCERLQ
jgi:hypothetical protein